MWLLAFVLVACGPSGIDDIPPPEIGEGAVDGPVTFIVRSFRCGVGEPGEAEVRADRLCLMELDAINSSDEERRVVLDAQRLVTYDGARFAPAPDATFDANAGRVDREIHPRQSLVATVAFELLDPEEIEFAVLHSSDSSPGVEVRLGRSRG